MSKLQKIEAVIESLHVACMAEGDLSELLGNAVVWLEMQKHRADSAEEAIEDALRDVPWVEHPGNGDPTPDFPDYVQVRFRDGTTRCGVRWDWDQNWSWSSKPRDGDIVAYRALLASSPHASPLLR